MGSVSASTIEPSGFTVTYIQISMMSEDVRVDENRIVKGWRGGEEHTLSAVVVAKILLKCSSYIKSYNCSIRTFTTLIVSLSDARLHSALFTHPRLLSAPLFITFDLYLVRSTNLAHRTMPDLLLIRVVQVAL